MGRSSVPSAAHTSDTARTSGTNFQGIEASPCLSGAPAPFMARTSGPTTTSSCFNQSSVPSAVCTTGTIPSTFTINSQINGALSAGFTPNIQSQMSANGALTPSCIRTTITSLKPAGGDKCGDSVARGVGHVESEMGLPQSENVNTMARRKENCSSRRDDALLNLQQTSFPLHQG